MSPAARCSLGAVALGAALLPAGCGTDAVTGYRDQALRPLERRLDAQRARIAARLRAVRPGRAADARALRADVSALAASVAALAALPAPAGLRRAQAAAAARGRRLVGELRALAGAVARGATAPVQRAGARVRAAAGGFEGARNALDEQVGS